MKVQKIKIKSYHNSAWGAGLLERGLFKKWHIRETMHGVRVLCQGLALITQNFANLEINHDSLRYI